MIKMAGSVKGGKGGGGLKVRANAVTSTHRAVDDGREERVCRFVFLFPRHNMHNLQIQEQNRTGPVWTPHFSHMKN